MTMLQAVVSLAKAAGTSISENRPRCGRSLLDGAKCQAHMKVLAIYPVLFQLALSRVAAFYLMGLLVHRLEKLDVVGIVGGKYFPNHPVADGVAVLTEMRASMVISTDGHHIANVVQSPAVQWDDVMGLKVEPAARGSEALLAAKLTASVDRPGASPSLPLPSRVQKSLCLTPPTFFGGGGLSRAINSPRSSYRTRPASPSTWTIRASSTSASSAAK